MLTKVIFDNGIEGTVHSFELNYLIRKRKIIGFRRSSGWVEIGQDPIRKSQHAFEGSGSRENDQLLK